MKALAALVFLILLPVVSTVEKPPRLETPRIAASAGLRSRGNTLFHAHKYLEACRTYEEGYRGAIKIGDTVSATRFLGNIGSCRFAVFQYRRAMQAFLEARRMAEQNGDLDTIVATSCNISSLYLQMGELNAGVQAARRGLKALRGHGSSNSAADLLAQAAVLRARQNDMAAAESLFHQAIDEADGRPGKLYLKAFAWELLGYEFLARERLDAAEKAFLEAFRLRKLGRLPDLQYSFYDLGMLSLAKGDPLAASRLLTRAIQESSRVPGTLPLWRIHYQRGRAWKMLGRATDALADFQRSVEYIRRWRVELLPAESFWKNTGVEVQQVYSALIDAAVEQYYRTGDQGLLRLSFQSAEENRAVSLRAMLRRRSRWREKLPDEYWQALAQLRKQDVVRLRRDTPAVRESIAALTDRLTEFETKAGLDLAAAPFPINSVPEPAPAGAAGKELHPAEAYLSFQLGESVSFRWSLMRGGLRVGRLPGRAIIASQVRELRRAISLGRPESGRLAGRLYAELFGSVGGEVERKQHWLLALDDVLFELPFAGLVTEVRGGRPVFLIERHSLQIKPAASMVASRTDFARDGPFVGVCDPVYNTADPRWTGSLAGNRLRGGLLQILPGLLAGSQPDPRVELARLPMGAWEIRRCARAWNSSSCGSLVLEGMEASEPKLQQALGRKPGVVHFATHFLMSRRPRDGGAWPDMNVNASGEASRLAKLFADEANIALSLTSAGQETALSAETISAWSLPAALVVLSGCSSGKAESLPGSGLMGLTNAWLAAGAGAVVASYWPAPDDTGELFVSFYRHLRAVGPRASGGRVAAALQGAQLEMLRSGSWRSLPRYWAAYFSVGKE